jgi:hypothetical protein
MDRIEIPTRTLEASYYHVLMVRVVDRILMCITPDELEMAVLEVITIAGDGKKREQCAR